MQIMLVWVVRLALIFLFLEWSTACPFCKDQFRKKKYIPDFAKDVKSTHLKVVYAGKSIKCGDTVNILQAINPPTLYFNLPRRCRFATVMTFAPDSVVLRPYLDWLVINIPPDNLRKGFTTPRLINKKNNGYIVSDYIIPKDPTGGSGIRNNTIIFFVYCQLSYNRDKRKITRPFRGPFNVTDYAKKHSLGDPVAGLFHLFSPTGVTLPTLVTLPALPV